MRNPHASSVSPARAQGERRDETPDKSTLALTSSLYSVSCDFAALMRTLEDNGEFTISLLHNFVAEARVFIQELREKSEAEALDTVDGHALSCLLENSELFSLDEVGASLRRLGDMVQHRTEGETSCEIWEVLKKMEQTLVGLERFCHELEESRRRAAPSTSEGNADGNARRSYHSRPPEASDYMAILDHEAHDRQTVERGVRGLHEREMRDGAGTVTDNPDLLGSQLGDVELNEECTRRSPSGRASSGFPSSHEEDAETEKNGARQKPRAQAARRGDGSREDSRWTLEWHPRGHVGKIDTDGSEDKLERRRFSSMFSDDDSDWVWSQDDVQEVTRDTFSLVRMCEDFLDLVLNAFADDGRRGFWWSLYFWSGMFYAMIAALRFVIQHPT